MTQFDTGRAYQLSSVVAGAVDIRASLEGGAGVDTGTGTLSVKSVLDPSPVELKNDLYIADSDEYLDLRDIRRIEVKALFVGVLATPTAYIKIYTTNELGNVVTALDYTDKSSIVSIEDGVNTPSADYKDTVAFSLNTENATFGWIEVGGVTTESIQLIVSGAPIV